MHRIWNVCVGTITILAVAVVPLGTIPAVADGEGESVPIVKQWSGSYSAQEATKQVVVRDSEAWKQLWRTVHGRRGAVPELPEVDFQKDMVIGVFMGSRPSGGYSVRITRIVQNQKIVATVREDAPGPNEMVTMALTAPYHLVVVPRSEKPIEYVPDRQRKWPGPPRSRGLLK